METIGMIFCGLGLFFIGFRMISQNLRQLTGSRFRRMVGQATRNRFLSGLTGFVSGAVTQSAMAYELEANLRKFSVTALSTPKTLSHKPLTIQIIESLRTILDTSIESFENPDRSGLEIILSITADRDELLQQIRQDFIQKNANLDTNQRESLYTMTILFDRVCWLLHKMTVIRLNWTELMSLPHLAGKR